MPLLVGGPAVLLGPGGDSWLLGGSNSKQSQALVTRVRHPH